MMHHFLWGKVVLVLVAIVAILQVVHLVLLSRLEARHHHYDNSNNHAISNVKSNKNSIQDYNSDAISELQATEVETAFGNLVRTLEQSRVLDSSGEYQVVPGIATALKQPHPHRLIGTTPDISLVTQCSYDHLHRLVQLSQRWQGPISVAVFAEDHQISDALWKVAGLRSCYTGILHNVSFSLVSPLPAKSSPPISIPSIPPAHPCQLKPTRHNHDNDPSNGDDSDSNHHRNYDQYKNFPNNLLRNVARRSTPSDFILVVDIDMLPSANLRQDFFEFASQRGLFRKSEREDKTVFVVPAFELKEGVTPPRHKKQLLKMVETGEVRPFYSELCWKCQIHTDYESWQREPPSSELIPLFEVLWKDPWEPFYIARNTVPFYDERFKQYGFNRISQVCELHIAGYKFSVLNNAFLVHLGFKTSFSFHSDKDIEQERNRLLFRQFKMELKSKYPESSRKCY